MDFLRFFHTLEQLQKLFFFLKDLYNNNKNNFYFKLHAVMHVGLLANNEVIKIRKKSKKNNQHYTTNKIKSDKKLR